VVFRLSRRRATSRSSGSRSRRARLDPDDRGPRLARALCDGTAAPSGLLDYWRASVTRSSQLRGHKGSDAVEGRSGTQGDRSKRWGCS
jgi:hypothetical protein